MKIFGDIDLEKVEEFADLQNPYGFTWSEENVDKNRFKELSGKMYYFNTFGGAKQAKEAYEDAPEENTFYQPFKNINIFAFAKGYQYLEVQELKKGPFSLFVRKINSAIGYLDLDGETINIVSGTGWASAQFKQKKSAVTKKKCKRMAMHLIRKSCSNKPVDKNIDYTPEQLIIVKEAMNKQAAKGFTNGFWLVTRRLLQEKNNKENNGLSRSEKRKGTEGEKWEENKSADDETKTDEDDGSEVFKLETKPTETRVEGHDVEQPLAPYKEQAPSPKETDYTSEQMTEDPKPITDLFSENTSVEKIDLTVNVKLQKASCIKGENIVPAIEAIIGREMGANMKRNGSYIGNNIGKMLFMDFTIKNEQEKNKITLIRTNDETNEFDIFILSNDL